MYSKSLIVIMVTLGLAGCQQGQAGSADTAERMPPKPLIEPIDPASNPAAAVKARKQQMAQQVDLKAMHADVMALIGEARADNVAQCRVVGFGSKPCGGPARYIAVSVKDGNEGEIMAKIGQYNAAAKAENERLGLMSDCAVVPKPTVTLKDGVCTLQDSGDSAAF
ncbi:hypothetical protein HRH59_11500 [Rheinheimera sp. YQF-2]|uniref:Uncharacterized protein n=1 Tax=Rheinheimera lutimaris TaxID=2740584 RepID=A0A7Y5ELG0_9GAMM|nr:hypothetical protein [Rheinheimera lutimaris]NRQ43168.1 hypothetical protein [Rheinheimera lutimaris]